MKITIDTSQGIETRTAIIGGVVIGLILSAIGLIYYGSQSAEKTQEISKRKTLFAKALKGDVKYNYKNPCVSYPRMSETMIGSICAEYVFTKPSRNWTNLGRNLEKVSNRAPL